jgi:hypothetical protein
MTVAAAVVLGIPPVPVHAQDTRAETLRAEREQKQQAVIPPRTTTIERVLKAVETSGVPLITRDGVYAKLGTLTTGSGFAAGAGYRTRRLLARDYGLDVWAGGSLTGYWATQARLQVPLDPAGRVVLNAFGRRHDYPREDFFGVGPDSLRAAHSDFRMRATTVAGRATANLVGPLAVGGGVEYLDLRVSNGSDKATPSIGQLFDDVSAPGLASRPDFVRTSAFVDIDARRPVNARRGGWYRAEFSHYADRDQQRYSFNRLDVDLRQFASILSERRVFMGRAYVSTSDTSDGQTMPFYLMPTLGGNDSLRGFRDYRFRGPHALLLQGEYRFEVWSGLDAALFYDAGKVAMRREDLNFRRLESDYGVGLRVNTDNGLILRVDSAFGSRDGAHLWVVLGGVF